MATEVPDGQQANVIASVGLGTTEAEFDPFDFLDRNPAPQQLAVFESLTGGIQKAAIVHATDATSTEADVNIRYQALTLPTDSDGKARFKVSLTGPINENRQAEGEGPDWTSLDRCVLSGRIG